VEGSNAHIITVPKESKAEQVKVGKESIKSSLFRFVAGSTKFEMHFQTRNNHQMAKIIQSEPPLLLLLVRIISSGLLANRSLILKRFHILNSI
jgi:hypothetical protein